MHYKIYKDFELQLENDVPLSTAELADLLGRVLDEDWNPPTFPSEYNS